MMKHREWEVLIAYFREIPINEELIKKIEVLLAVKKNVLVMIAKENPEDNPRFTQKEKFKALCKIFPDETKLNLLRKTFTIFDGYGYIKLKYQGDLIFSYISHKHNCRNNISHS